MADELREFVYLDSMSVNSLLASQYVAIPETIRDVSEEIEGDDGKKGINASLGFQGVGSIGGQWKSGESEQNRRMAETERRINDQYRFSMLYKALESSDQLEDLSTKEATAESSINLSQGQVIKAEGIFETDPFYRLLSAVSLLMRLLKAEDLPQEDGEFDETEELVTEEGIAVFDLWKEILHGEQIGLRVEPENFRYPIIMSIGVENLWVNPEREFLGAKQYTVVARLSQTISGEETWDFIDLLRIAGSVFSEESVDSLRDALTEIGDNLAKVDEDGFQFDVEISRDDYVVDEPAIVVDPVAIYW